MPRDTLCDPQVTRLLDGRYPMVLAMRRHLYSDCRLESTEQAIMKWTHLEHLSCRYASFPARLTG